MDLSWLNQIITAHTFLAYFLIGLISMLESLAFVGLFIPGTVMMFLIGTLVGTGNLELYSTLICAAFGAIIGDGLSYSLGAYFHDNLKNLRWVHRYQYLLTKGEAFFHKHGGKSVVFGRFVGPVRPIIPVVAGMLDMPKNRFFLTNVISALLWAPAYTLPGVFFGTSLTLLSQISTRLAIVLLLAFAIIFLTNIILKKLVYFLEKLAHLTLKKLQDWNLQEWGTSSSSPASVGKRLIQKLLFPQKEEDFLTTFLILICFVFFWIFFWTYLDNLIGRANNYPLEALNNFIQSLRTPWADHFFVLVHNLGSIIQTFFLALSVLIFLSFSKAKKSVSYWITVILGGLIIDQFISWTCPLSSLLSNHLTIPSLSIFYKVPTFLNVTCYGSLAILMTRGTSSRYWWTYFWTALVITTLTAFSKLYLERSNLLLLLSQISIGWSWTALLGIVFLRTKKEPVPLPGLKTVIFVCLIIVTMGLSKINHRQLMQKYQPINPIQTLSFKQWLETDWQRVPLYRLTFRGQCKQPLFIQYAGPVEVLNKTLASLGWHRPPQITLRSWLYTLSPTAKIEELPILPHLHQGYPEQLFLFKRIQGQAVVLHLWPSGFTLRAEQKIPLWVGTMIILKKKRLVNLLFLAMDSKDYNLPVSWLERTFKPPNPLGMKIVSASEPSGKHREIFLVYTTRNHKACKK